jgi:hypothetical protein
MSAVTELVRTIIATEEARVLMSWKHQETRLGLLQICRAIDSLVLGAQKDPEAFELSREGTVKAVSLFMDQSWQDQRIPFFPSDDHTFRWAHSVLQHCGRIAVCEKFIEYEQAGLGRFVELGGDLQFEITPKYAGIEALEEKEFAWLERSISANQDPIRALMNSLQPKVHDRMRELVYVWYDHYIGYGGEPRIDAYFDHQGILAAQRMTGHDVFADDARFGGLPFGLYRAAVWTLIGWALKHVSFALLLHEKHPELRLENLLAVTVDVAGLTSEIAASLQVTTREAAQALYLLELNVENASRVCINGHAAPPLIRAASEQFLKPVAGFLIEPFQFMLRNLRAEYRSDWDRAVNDREALFRVELFELFPQQGLRKLPKQVRLRRGGNTLTDIDAVVIDKTNGIAGLFQLKWQDPFGHSTRERAARMRNFQREATSWVNAVTEFLQNSTDQDINRLFGLPESALRPQCRLFVVGRYFAHFSGEAAPDGRAAWAVWPQLMRLACADRDCENPIAQLHTAVATDSPFNKNISLSLPSFQLGGRTIKVKKI